MIMLAVIAILSYFIPKPCSQSIVLICFEVYVSSKNMYLNVTLDITQYKMRKTLFKTECFPVSLVFQMGSRDGPRGGGVGGLITI